MCSCRGPSMWSRFEHFSWRVTAGLIVAFAAVLLASQAPALSAEDELSESGINIFNVCNHTQAVWTEQAVSDFKKQPTSDVAVRLGVLIGTYPLHVWGEAVGGFVQLPDQMAPRVGIKDHLLPSLVRGLRRLGLAKVPAALQALPQWPDKGNLLLGGPSTGPGAWTLIVGDVPVKQWSAKFRACFTQPSSVKELEAKLGKQNWRRALAIAIMMDDFNREQSIGMVRGWYLQAAHTNRLLNYNLLREGLSPEQLGQLSVSLVKEAAASGDEQLARVCKAWLQARSLKDRSGFANEFLLYLDSVGAIDWPAEYLPPKKNG